MYKYGVLLRGKLTLPLPACRDVRTIEWKRIWRNREKYLTEACRESGEKTVQPQPRRAGQRGSPAGRERGHMLCSCRLKPGVFNTQLFRVKVEKTGCAEPPRRLKGRD